jgi:hypothetical protein
MTESQPRNDFASFPAPAEGILVAMFITVRKVAIAGLLLPRPGRHRHPGGEPVHCQAGQLVDHHESRRAAHP